MDELNYLGREQSWVKHKILEQYLLRFALIVGSKWQSLTYVDGFSGPWESQSGKFEDTSFSIALNQLRSARDHHASKGRKIQLRAVFVEQNKSSYALLENYVKEIDDIEILILNRCFEKSITTICDFIERTPGQTFPFIFIDPKGWTGFTLDIIRPLIQLRPCEVLVNFMTQHIVRFINNEASRESFERLFGSKDFADHLQGLQREERNDAAVFRYRDVISEAGHFTHPGIASILNPLKNRSHFHLIYLSRNAKGLEVFKKAEYSSMQQMESIRAKAQQSNRVQKTGQRELFADEDAPESTYYLSLRIHYIRLAKFALEAHFDSQKRINYDEAWRIWLQFPLVWEQDLKEWIEESEEIKIEGLKPKARRPQRGKGHFLIHSKD